MYSNRNAEQIILLDEARALLRAYRGSFRLRHCLSQPGEGGAALAATKAGKEEGEITLTLTLSPTLALTLALALSLSLTLALTLSLALTLTLTPTLTLTRQGGGREADARPRRPQGARAGVRRRVEGWRGGGALPHDRHERHGAFGARPARPR